MKIVLPLLLALASLAAFAADRGHKAPPTEPHQMSAEMKAAFDSCKDKGKPGETAFESCMTALGFAKPAGQEPPAVDRQQDEEVSAD